MLVVDHSTAKKIHDTAKPLVIQVIQQAVRQGGFDQLHLTSDSIVFDDAIQAPSVEPAIQVRVQVKGLVNNRAMFAAMLLQTSNRAWVPSHLLFEVEPKHRQLPSFRGNEHRYPIEDRELLVFIQTIGQKQN